MRAEQRTITAFVMDEGHIHEDNLLVELADIAVHTRPGDLIRMTNVKQEYSVSAVLYGDVNRRSLTLQDRVKAVAGGGYSVLTVESLNAAKTECIKR